MPYNISCPFNLHFRTGAFYADGTQRFPAIKNQDGTLKTIYVSFDIEDCKKTLPETLIEDQLDQHLSKYDDWLLQKGTSITQLLEVDKHFKDIPIDIKKQILLFSPYLGYLTSIHEIEINYYIELIQQLSCLTNLNFKIVDKLPKEDASAYKIAICATKDTALQTSGSGLVAVCSLSIKDNPSQSVIQVDEGVLIEDVVKMQENMEKTGIWQWPKTKEEILWHKKPLFWQDPKNTKEAKNVLLQQKQHTLGHEFLHALGLAHPVYESIEENQKYRSIMENDSPLWNECLMSSSFSDSYYAYKRQWIKKAKCYNAPTKATDQDICGLNSLYGNSLSEKPEVCNKIMHDFAKEYPDLEITYFGLDRGVISNSDYEL